MAEIHARMDGWMGEVKLKDKLGMGMQVLIYERLQWKRKKECIQMIWAYGENTKGKPGLKNNVLLVGGGRKGGQLSFKKRKEKKGRPIRV